MPRAGLVDEVFAFGYRRCAAHLLDKALALCESNIIYAAHLAEGSLWVGVIGVGGKEAAIMAGNHLHLKDLNVKVLNA